MKYELMNETIEVFRYTLHRVRYIESGELGGWIEHEGNLSQDGKAVVCDDAYVFGKARVSGDARVCGGARVSDNAKIYGKAHVLGDAWICDNAFVSGNARVLGDARISGNAHIYGDALINGTAQVLSDAYVSDNAGVSGNARVGGNSHICGNAHILGDARISGNAKIYGKAYILGDARISGEARVCDGVWEKSPLQIQGSRYFFNVASQTKITVGCHIKTITEWIVKYEQEFDEHDFTDEQRTEYKLYFNLAAWLYGWEERILIKEN